jgi:hypothetical protein
MSYFVCMGHCVYLKSFNAYKNGAKSPTKIKKLREMGGRGRHAGRQVQVSSLTK